MPNSPIVNAGIKYCNGLALAKTAAKVISMGAGAARDSSNTNDIILSAPVSINGAVVGANGVDVAVLVADSMYGVYVIGDSTEYQSTAGLLSLDDAQPNLPFGYDMYRRVGWVLTDGSSNILQFWQYGLAQERTFYYDVGISELSGGSSSSSFAEVDLASSVPPIATEVLIEITFTPDGATEVAQFLPFGSSASNGIVQFGAGVAGAQVAPLLVPCELDDGVPKILYKVASGDTLSFSVIGFKDYLS